MALDSNTLGIGRTGIGGGMMKRPTAPRVRKADLGAPMDGDYDGLGAVLKGMVSPPPLVKGMGKGLGKASKMMEPAAKKSCPKRGPTGKGGGVVKPMKVTKPPKNGTDATKIPKGLKGPNL